MIFVWIYDDDQLELGLSKYVCISDDVLRGCTEWSYHLAPHSLFMTNVIGYFLFLDNVKNENSVLYYLGDWYDLLY